MLDANEKKVYMQIGLGRLLDIQVILDENLVYDGIKAEDLFQPNLK